MHERTIIIKSAGEMASGIAVRLYRAGCRRILMLETACPLAVRRTVSFCEAVYEGSQQVEGVTGRLASSLDEAERAWAAGEIAVCVDPGWTLVKTARPFMLVDATLAKRNLGTNPDEAPLVVAMGPGFTAGVDAHYVIETHRGHNLGRVFDKGCALPNTGIPGSISGYTVERVLRAPADGIVVAHRDIGDEVAAGERIFTVAGQDALAGISGVLRGCIRPGTEVSRGLKIGDIDPRNDPSFCRTVSEKARALGGSVLEVFCGSLRAAGSRADQL